MTPEAARIAPATMTAMPSSRISPTGRPLACGAITAGASGGGATSAAVAGGVATGAGTSGGRSVPAGGVIRVGRGHGRLLSLRKGARPPPSVRPCLRRRRGGQRLDSGAASHDRPQVTDKSAPWEAELGASPRSDGEVRRRCPGRELVGAGGADRHGADAPGFRSYRPGQRLVLPADPDSAPRGRDRRGVVRQAGRRWFHRRLAGRGDRRAGRGCRGRLAHLAADGATSPIGLFGHSQGGWVVVEAARRATPAAFVITNSGPGVSPAVQDRFALAVRRRARRT